MLDVVHTRQLLENYCAFDETDAAQLDVFTAFLNSLDPQTGSSAGGRLSAGGWIIDSAARRVLLIHNQRLQLWLNPGGKYEPEDGTVTATMQREVREESGIIAPAGAPLFDISYIGLDYSPRLSCPLFDFRFLVEADSKLPLHPQETDKQPQWLSLQEVKTRMPDDAQNRRLLRRTEALLGL